MEFELPKLPYGVNALEPIISSSTIGFHYGKHHYSYVMNLNKLIVGTSFENSTLEEMITKADGPIYNNAAQIWNHTFYFKSLISEGDGGEICGPLKRAITTQWNSVADFKKEFVTAGATLFGSGWVWLVQNEKRQLTILKESNAGNPLRNGHKPILTFDVWEHAYYLDYQNRRADYLNDLWRIVNWEIVNKRFECLLLNSDIKDFFF